MPDENALREPGVLATLAGLIGERNDDQDAEAAKQEVPIQKRALRLMLWSRTRKAQPYIVLTFRLPAELFFEIDWGEMVIARPPTIGAPIRVGPEGKLISFLQFRCQNQAFLDLRGRDFDCYRFLRIRLPSGKWDTHEHPILVLDSDGCVMANALLRIQRERLAVWTAADQPIRLVNAYEPFDVSGPRMQNVDFTEQTARADT